MSSSPRLRRSRHWIAESLWTVDALLIGMLLFFIVLGAFSPFDSLTLAIVLAVLVAGWIIHARSMRRAGTDMTPEQRRARERRGF
jgi:hypothetical protein